MPNYYLSVLYKHIIQVKNKNVGLKVGGGHKHTFAPPIKKVGGAHAPLAPPPPPLPTPVIYIYISGVGRCQKVGGGGGTQTRDLSTFGKEPI